MKKKLAAFMLAAVLCLSCVSCGTSGVDATSQATASVDSISSTDEMFTDRDFEVGYSDYVTVTLADSGSHADGGGVTVDGSTVTITQEGTYLLTGSLSSGQIIVDAPDTAKIQLVLDNLSVTCPDSAAIYVKQADKVFLTTTEGSENSLNVTGDYVQTDDNKVDAVIFSKSDLTINGGGTLNISTSYGHGVVSKDDLKVTSGTYVITSASHGLSGKDSVRIADGSFTITSGKDGIHAENNDDTALGFIFISGGTFTINAEADGMDAATTLAIEDGTYVVTTGGGSANASTKSNGQPADGQGQPGMPDGQGGGPGGQPGMPDGGAQVAPDATGSAAEESGAEETDDTTTAVSAKGLKAGENVTVNGGTFTLDCSDDAVHTNGNLTVTGGTFQISTGDDGMHADAALAITDGTIDIAKSYEGIEGATIDLSGGTISVVSSDDGLNATGNGSDGRQNGMEADTSASILISGGALTINASGDGIDSNGNLTVSGGSVYVSGPTSSGDGALDYSGTGTITGGVLIAAGSTGMAQNLGSDSTQGSILYNLSSAQNADTSITLTDSSGNILASYTPVKQFQSVVVSAPGVKSGSSYTLTVGSESIAIEMTDTIYGGGSGGGGGMGNGSGGMGQRPGGGGTPPSRDNADAATGATPGGNETTDGTTT